MEVGGPSDRLLILVKQAATLPDDGVQILDRIEVSVHEWLIDASS
jgi:chaperonin GroEL (HSP60 family)